MIKRGGGAEAKAFQAAEKELRGATSGSAGGTGRELYKRMMAYQPRHSRRQSHRGPNEETALAPTPGTLIRAFGAG